MLLNKEAHRTILLSWLEHYNSFY